MLLRCPFAVWNPGPAWKAGYPLPWPYGGLRGPKRGEVKHSAEGYWPGLYSRLLGPDRASWHFTIGFDRIEQHYDIDVHCWHGGDVDDDGGIRTNIEAVGIEHLGVAGQPLDPYQVNATSRLSRWLMDQFGYRQATRASGSGLWLLREHNEVSDQPTACPSGRIPWAAILARLGQGGDMEFHRLNGRSAWFDAPANQTYGPGKHHMDLGTDFPAVPVDARLVELDIRVDPSTLARVAFKDFDGAYAGDLSRYVPERIIRVIPGPGPERRVFFDVFQSTVRFRLVGIVGYWT